MNPLRLAIIILLTALPVFGGGDEVARMIRQAGNLNSDQERLACLQQLQQRPDLDERLRADLNRLVKEIDQYIHNKQLDYFGKQLRRKMDNDFGISSDSPLYPLACFYRARMITWLVLETGNLWKEPKTRRELFDKVRGLFQETATAFPENKIAAMYLGRPQPAAKRYSASVNAPAWAAHQREALERLTDIIEWWIDHRQQPDGSYGGGWGDDCEMWRWWVPVLIGFDSPRISNAQARFSTALLSQPHMKGGYTSKMTDVEHTAEDSADAMTPMMHLDPDNPVWRERALRLAELMETLWTGRNERGFLQFKSTYFTSERVDPNPERACDTTYHPRAIQPALLYWQRTGDARLTRLFSAWMDTWVDAAARAERGKPAGVIPSAIHWPDGQIGGLGPDWWDPQNHSEPTLYRFPSAMSLMTHTLLLTAHITGNTKYLEPIRSMATLHLNFLRQPSKGTLVPGSADWCASNISVSGVLAKHKQLTGSIEFDERLKTTKPRDERNSFTKSLRQTAQAFAINFEGYTSEVRYTDRVLRFPTLFEDNTMFPTAISGFQSPSPSLLYSTVTGDPGDALYFPLNAVRWLTPPRDIAALVTATGSKRFAAELFHFGATPRSLAAELYLLEKGDYEWEQVVDGTAKQTRRFTVTGPRTRVAFDLPPQQLCRVMVCKVQ